MSDLFNSTFNYMVSAVNVFVNLFNSFCSIFNELMPDTYIIFIGAVLMISIIAIIRLVIS